MADPQDNLDTVQHPILGPLKFPKDMPYSERNDSIARVLAQRGPTIGRAASMARSAPAAMPTGSQIDALEAAYNPPITASGFQRAGAGLARGISAAAAYPADLAQQAVKAPSSPEERRIAQYTGQGGLAATRALIDPQIAEFKKAEQAKTPGEKAAYATAGLIPIFGPMASHIGEKIGTGDIAGGITEGLTTAAILKGGEMFGAKPEEPALRTKPTVEDAHATPMPGMDAYVKLAKQMDASPMKRSAADLMAASDVKEAPPTAEQLAEGKRKFLSLTKPNVLDEHAVSMARRQYVRPTMTGEAGEPARPVPEGETPEGMRRTPAQTRADIMATAARDKSDPFIQQHERNLAQRSAEAQKAREALGPLVRKGDELTPPPKPTDSIPNYYDRYGQVQESVQPQGVQKPTEAAEAARSVEHANSPTASGVPSQTGEPIQAAQNPRVATTETGFSGGRGPLDPGTLYQVQVHLKYGDRVDAGLVHQAFIDTGAKNLKELLDYEDPRTNTEQIEKEKQLKAVMGAARAVDTDWMGKARAELGPDATLSSVAMKAAELKNQAAKEIPGPGTQNISAPPDNPNALGELSESINRISKEGFDKSAMERQRIGQRVAEMRSVGADRLTSAWERMKASAASTIDSYFHLPAWTNVDDAIGKFVGAIQMNGYETQNFIREVKKIPKEYREAITNYIQADGDYGVLRDRALKSDPKYRAGYENAAKLPDNVKILANNIRNYFDSKLEQAQDEGMIRQGINDYVPQMWEKDNHLTQRMMGETNFGKIKMTPAFVKKRIFDTFFEGEQLGFTPKSKDIGYLLATYDQAFNKSIASRALVKTLHEGGLASDGRPIIGVDGGAVKVGSIATGDAATLIRPRAHPSEVADYKVLPHPAFDKWKWVGTDDFGNPEMMQGQLRVHPEFARRLKNVFTETSELRENPITRAIMTGGSYQKQVITFGSLFHQTQLGTHAVMHLTNPFSPEPLDFNRPLDRILVEHGTTVGGDTALQEQFEEGIGSIHQKYTGYLFHDYLPRLKMSMARRAFEKNMETYGPGTKANKTMDQIAALTSRQANAAFGGINTRLIGRHPVIQDVARLITFAPDFTEARFKFVGQALKPYGREQTLALMRGALGAYGMARLANYVISGNARTDKPFSVMYGDTEYSLRTLPGDIVHLIQDRNSFIASRMNPTIRTSYQLATGRDRFGHSLKGKDYAQIVQKNLLPIPIESMKFHPGTKDVVDSALRILGLQVYGRGPASKPSQAMPPTPESKENPVTK